MFMEAMIMGIRYERSKLRRGVATALVAALPLALGAAAPAAQAETVRWGTLGSSSGSIYQWEVAQWIAGAFRDGNTSDTAVDTSMTLYFTQCYAGDWLSSFNATTFQGNPGGLYDRWRFNNATGFAGNEPGELTKYNGYHRAAAAAFSPAFPGGVVHFAGVAGKASSENPIYEGQLTRPIGGDRTYVLVYAADPEGPDWLDVTDIFVRGLAHPGTSVVALSGTGTRSGLEPYDLRPARREELQAAITEIGGALRAGNIDHFSLFVTDHGGLATVDVAPPVITPAAAASLDLAFLAGQVLGAQTSRYGLLEFGFYESPGSMFDPDWLSVLVNGRPLPLLDPFSRVIDAPDPAGGIDPVAQYVFGFQFDLGLLNLSDRNRLGEFSQFVDISFLPGAPADWSLNPAWISLSPGGVMRPDLPVPEPGPLGLMLVGLVSLGAATVRRAQRRA